jgi:hypothetical protein
MALIISWILLTGLVLSIALILFIILGTIAYVAELLLERYYK